MAVNRHARATELEFPHRVEMPPRAGGWGRQLDEMYAWAKTRCGNDGYRKLSDWHFKDAAAAAAFAKFFGFSASTFTGVDLSGRPPKRRRR